MHPSSFALHSNIDLAVEHKWWMQQVARKNRMTRFVKLQMVLLNLNLTCVRVSRNEMVTDRQKQHADTCGTYCNI